MNIDNNRNKYLLGSIFVVFEPTRWKGSLAIESLLISVRALAIWAADYWVLKIADSPPRNIRR